MTDISLEKVNTMTTKMLATVNTTCLNNDKLINVLISGEKCREEALSPGHRVSVLVNQGDKSKGEKIVVSATLETNSDKYLAKPTAFDMAVHNTISALYYYNKIINPGQDLYVTPQQIWRAMTGQVDAARDPTTAQVASVDASVQKMASIQLTLDVREELKAGRLNITDSRFDQGCCKSNILAAKETTFATIKGTPNRGYCIYEEPVLHTYATAKKHVIYADYSLLNTSDTTRDDSHTIAIRQYLLQQVSLMYGRQRNSSRILYDSIYKHTGIPSPEERCREEDYTSSEVYKSRIRNCRTQDYKKIDRILESWVNKGFLKGYSRIKDAGIPRGIDVTLNYRYKGHTR